MELPLPDDALADILGRLGPYDLHTSRQVCTAWRAIIHDRHARLLPLPLAGIFVVPTRSLPIKFSAPRSSSSSSPIRNISGDFSYVDTPADADDGVQIQQHCNGLLLLEQWCSRGDNDDFDFWCVNTVLDPATRRWARLPPSPGASLVEYAAYEDEEKMLVFDPAVSPYDYEVFAIKSLPFEPWPSEAVPEEIRRLEWPPSPFLVRVFSSTTRRWEEKELIREGDPAGIIDKMILLDPRTENHYGVYHQGVLYVHQHDFLMRITLSNHRYQVIKLPGDVETGHHIRKSKKGIYCTLIYDPRPRPSSYNGPRFCVWFLDESSSPPSHHRQQHMKWVLKHDIKLDPLLLLAKPPPDDDDDTSTTMPWSIQRHADDDRGGTRTGSPPVIGEDVMKRCPPPISMLGFHPHRDEIIFLHVPPERVVAFHLSSSSGGGYRVEELGSLLIHHGCGISMSVPYTPYNMHEDGGLELSAKVYV